MLRYYDRTLGPGIHRVIQTLVAAKKRVSMFYSCCQPRP